MRRCLRALCLAIAIAFASGCASRNRVPRVEFTTYDENGDCETRLAHFSRAAYRASPGGLLAIVMEGESPSSIDPTQTIRQIVYVKTLWYPQPGRTYVEATQMDATMMYAVLTPPTGVRYDGSAMLTYKWNSTGKEIRARIESGTLAPAYRMGEAIEPFGPSRFLGEATVYEDPGQVVKTLQFLKTQFSERMPAQASSIMPITEAR